MRTIRLMGSFIVHARPLDDSWELDITGLGVTHSPTLDDAETVAAEYICARTGLAPDTFAYAIVWESADAATVD